ncbi:hypothetical protein ES332_A13G077500v1 [Gossypium tomentosum]|uniref:PB1-like domain-containing protein n=1 Tax=Gossypium tomentosum TaxID=34277 RepID=A0A5D2MHJ4_GOSTO|nr:hypothetical protein ES332_A13G077500v1 [Gossypium tomentosum]
MISWDKEYYLILHMGGHFVKDPYIGYVGGEVIRLKEDLDTIYYFELCKIVKIRLGFHTTMLVYFHEPGTVGLQNNLKVIYDNTSTIAMLDFWVKFKEIHLYAEHEVDNPIIVDDMLLLTAGESDVKGVEADREGDVEKVDLDGDDVVEGVQAVREGVQAIGEDHVEGVEANGKGDIERVQADMEDDVEGVQAEADKYSGGESDGQISLVSTVGEENVSGFGSSVSDENAVYFATSDGVDNIVTAVNGEEEDGNETEFLKNELKRVVVRCIASPNYPWRILASYSLIAKCMQIINFQEKHHCLDHPKMKLREIKRICVLEVHVNVSIDCCYKAKKIVKEKMVRNHKEEFVDSSPHFKRFYVCFDALKKGWKPGCRPLIGLDG